MSLWQAIRDIWMFPDRAWETLRRDYRRWAKKVRQQACPHDFEVTVSWTGSRKFCKKCHLTKDFVPWS